MEFPGVVTKLLASATFGVEPKNRHRIIAHARGGLRNQRIQSLAGDKMMLVERAPYDLTKGRITYRFD